MVDLKKYKPTLCFLLALNVVVAVWVTLASFIHYPLHHAGAYVRYGLHFLALQFSVCGFLYILVLNRWVFAVFFTPLFLLFSGAAFWVYTQDITLSHALVRATLETKPDVAIDLISGPLLLYWATALLAALALVWYRWKIKIDVRHWPLALFALCGLMTFYAAENFKYGVFKRRLPYALADAVQQYAQTDALRFAAVPAKMTAATKPLNIIFVLGETVRADHMQLNGYARATNPLLSQQTQLLSFARTYTNKTYTAESLQQLFTDAGLEDQTKVPRQSLLQLLTKAQVVTRWIGNQTPEKSYEDFIAHCQHQEIIDPFHSELSFRKSYDEALLPRFEKTFSATRTQFTVLHMMGSHWWYETRYPDAFRKFLPVIQSKDLNSNSREEMVNSYDNTILYLDYFLNRLVQKIAPLEAPVLLIYLSDHGELLGEDGKWLHAQKGQGVSNPAMLVAYSKGFAQTRPDALQKLQNASSQHLPLDFFFPTILELYGITGVSTRKGLLSN